MAQRWQRSMNTPTMRTPEPTLAPKLHKCTAVPVPSPMPPRALLLHTAPCSRAPDVSHGGCTHRPSKFSSGASRHPQDRAPSQCCVHRGVSAAAVRQVATSLRCRSHSVLLQQMPNFGPVLDRISTMPSSPRSLRRRCVRMRIRRRRTRSRLAHLHSIFGTHGT
jgi:hypothetical protein